MLASFLLACCLRFLSSVVVIVVSFVPILLRFASRRGERHLITLVTNTCLVCVAVIYGPAGHPCVTWLS